MLRFWIQIQRVSYLIIYEPREEGVQYIIVKNSITSAEASKIKSDAVYEDTTTLRVQNKIQQ